MNNTKIKVLLVEDKPLLVHSIRHPIGRKKEQTRLQEWVKEIKIGGEVRGMVGVYYTQEKPFLIPEEENLMEVIAEDLSLWIERKETHQQLEKALEGTVNALANTLEQRDPYTAGHQKKVTQLALAIAEKMELPEERIEGLRVAGKVHDIGKINVPAEILSKPTELTDTEMDLVRSHAQTGYEILKDIDFPWPVADIVHQHHERLDGSGYPRGLEGKEIRLEARILGVADVVEAMSAHRPYRPAKGADQALEEIKGNKSRLYDPQVVEACIKLFKEDGFEFEGGG